MPLCTSLMQRYFDQYVRGPVSYRAVCTDNVAFVSVKERVQHNLQHVQNMLLFYYVQNWVTKIFDVIILLMCYCNLKYFYEMCNILISFSSLCSLCQGVVRVVFLPSASYADCD